MDLADYKGGAVTVRVPLIEITDAQARETGGGVEKREIDREIGRERENRCHFLRMCFRSALWQVLRYDRSTLGNTLPFCLLVCVLDPKFLPLP